MRPFGVALLALVLTPAATAYACGNAMVEAVTGPPLSYFWLGGLLLHVLTLPFVGKRLAARLLSLAAMLAAGSVVGIAFSARLHLDHLWLLGLEALLIGGLSLGYLLSARSAGGPRLID